MSGRVWWSNREKRPRHGTSAKKKDYGWLDDDNLFSRNGGESGVCGYKMRIALQLRTAESGSRRVNETD